MNSTSAPIGLPAAVLKEVLAEVSNTQASRYNYLALAFVNVYDTILNLDQEIDVIWLRQWSWVKVLYLTTRYLSLFSSFFLPSIFLYRSLNLSDAVCAGWERFQGASAIVVLAAVDGILIIRVWGMYSRSKAILIFLVTFAVLSLIASSATMAKSLTFAPFTSQPAPGFVVCVATVPRYFAAYWIPILAFDFTLFGLMLRKGLQNFGKEKLESASGLTGQHLANLMIRDSMLYYFLINAAYAANAAVWHFADPSLIEASSPWGIFLPPIMACRMILHIRDALFNRRGQGTEIELSDFKASYPTDPTAVTTNPSRGQSKVNLQSQSKLNIHRTTDSDGRDY